jgi:FdhE protein
MSEIGRLTSRCMAGRSCSVAHRAFCRGPSVRGHSRCPAWQRISPDSHDPAFIGFLPSPISHLRSVNLAEPVRTTPEALDPSWQKWLDLVDLAVVESRQPEWSEGIHLRDARTPDAPLLHGSTLRVNGSRTRDFTTTLARNLGLVALEAIDPLALLRAGVERDSGNLERLSVGLAISTDTAALLGQLSALPLLLNASRALSTEASRTWQRGYCRVCGAWPSMVEMRGIQRERRMRCGCCGSDWLLPVLRCAFCDETDHQKLGFLLSEEGEQHIRVETCATCRGYLKTLTTLGALPFAALAAKDMSTVAFDLAAQDRGYARPARPGWQLRVEVVQLLLLRPNSVAACLARWMRARAGASVAPETRVPTALDSPSNATSSKPRCATNQRLTSSRAGCSSAAWQKASLTARSGRWRWLSGTSGSSRSGPPTFRPGSLPALDPTIANRGLHSELAGSDCSSRVSVLLQGGTRS